MAEALDRDTVRASDNSGVRRYNERLILQALRRTPGASKAELARELNLSTQAALRIVDDLESAGLVVNRGRRFGGRGQPSIMYDLNPEGAFSIGAHIGRRGLELVLMDFLGQVVAQSSMRYDYPLPDDAIGAIGAFVDQQRAGAPLVSSRLVGLGVAMPWFIGEWRDKLEIGEPQAAAWKTSEFDQRLTERCSLPILFENDGNAATLAELFLGQGRATKSFIYIYIGTFVGGGVALDGAIRSGMNGNAAAFASMMVPPPEGGSGQPFSSLFERASVYVLEKQVFDRLGRRVDLQNSPAVLAECPELTEAWVTSSADALAFAILNINNVLDVETVVIDGSLPSDMLDAIIGATGTGVEAMRHVEMFPPTIIRGEIGRHARVIGAGLLPLFSSYGANMDTLLKRAIFQT